MELPSPSLGKVNEKADTISFYENLSDGHADLKDRSMSLNYEKDEPYQEKLISNENINFETYE